MQFGSDSLALQSLLGTEISLLLRQSSDMLIATLNFLRSPGVMQVCYFLVISLLPELFFLSELQVPYVQFLCQFRSFRGHYRRRCVPLAILFFLFLRFLTPARLRLRTFEPNDPDVLFDTGTVRLCTSFFPVCSSVVFCCFVFQFLTRFWTHKLK